MPLGSLGAEQKDELLCTYAALILHDDGAEINPTSMNTLIKAAGCSVESYWPLLMSRMINNTGMVSWKGAGKFSRGWTVVEVTGQTLVCWNIIRDVFGSYCIFSFCFFSCFSMLARRNLV